GEAVGELAGHTHCIHALAFSPDGKTLASADRNRVVRFWDVSKRREVGRVSCSAGALAYSPDGKILAAGGLSDNAVRLLDPGRREALRALRVPGGGVRSLAFSPDGKVLLTGGRAHSLYLCDVATGEAVRPLAGHQHAVLSVAFSPDGKTLASR